MPAKTSTFTGPAVTLVSPDTSTSSTQHLCGFPPKMLTQTELLGNAPTNRDCAVYANVEQTLQVLAPKDTEAHRTAL